jgi:transcription elongation factor SPT5
VYVEASTIDDIQSVLRGVSGIVSSRRRRPILDVVPLDDRVPILEMSVARTHPTRLSWVRLKCRGKYRDDLGLVLTFDPLELTATVYVVPRIHLSDHKRKRSSKLVPAALFDVEQAKFIYGANSVAKQNQIFVFKNDVYKNGLLEKKVYLTNLYHKNIHTTQYELDNFRRSGDEEVIKALNAMVVPLQIGDRIQATAGTFRGLAGYVVDIREDNTVAFQSETDNLCQSGEEETTRAQAVSHFQVCLSEVRKKFELGDYVQVLHGAHSGEMGYIVEMFGEDATIYKRCIVSSKHGTSEQPGAEVSSAFPTSVAQVDAFLRSKSLYFISIG